MRSVRTDRPHSLLAGLAAGVFWLVLLALSACEPTEYVTIETTDNAQQVVNAHPAGTAFRFAPGVHNGVHILPRSGNTFSAESLGSAILNGNGEELPAFRSRTNRMTSDWRRNVVIENLVFTNYSPQDYFGVIEATSDDYEDDGPEWQPAGNWAMRNLRFFDNWGSGDSAAITIGSGSRVSFVEVVNHPGVGIFGHGRNMTIEQSKITNTSGSAGLYWHSGGIKLVVAHDTVITNNEISGSSGPGVWIDISSDNVDITDNVIANNGLSGVFYEVSRNGNISGNTITSNGYGDERGWMFPGGIVLSTANETTVTNNNLSWNALGITVIDQRTLRSEDRNLAPQFGELFEADGTVMAWRAENNTISNNIVRGSGTTGVSAAGPESVGSTVYATTTFANNTYSGGPSFYWGSGSNYGSPRTAAQWQNIHPND